MTIKDAMVLTMASLLIVGAAFADSVHSDTLDPSTTSARAVLPPAGDSRYEAKIQLHAAAYEMLNETLGCPK